MIAEPPGWLAYQLANLALADAIEAHHFGLREKLLLGFIRQQSFGACRPQAYIPHYRYFAKAAGVSLGNVYALVENLTRLHVIEMKPEYWYGFIVPISAWRADLRTEDLEVIRQHEMLKEPPALRDALREDFVEQYAASMGKARIGSWSLTQAVGADGTDTRHGTPGETDAAVPESGTAATSQQFPIREKFPIRENDPQNKIPDSGITARKANDDAADLNFPIREFPDSGNAGKFANLQPCRNAIAVGSGSGSGSGTEHSCKAAFLTPVQDPVRRSQGVQEKIPDSGKPQIAKPKALDPERQDIFDECEALGAFGPDDGSKGCWFAFVRQRPNVLKELIGDYKYFVRTGGRVKKDAGAWMMSKWIHWGKPDDR